MHRPSIAWSCVQWFDWRFILTAAASLIAIGYAASTTNRLLAALVSSLFVVSIVWTGLKSLRQATTDKPTTQRLVVLRQTTCLSTLTLAWSAAALMAAYPLAGLRWQHGWQYGLAFAIAAAGFAIYSKRLSNDTDRLAQPGAVETAAHLALLQTIAIAATFVWMATSGVLATVKDDWLANDVFLAAGTAMLMLSIVFILKVRTTTNGS